MKFTNCDLSDIVKMTSENQARQIQLFDRKGSIAPGKDADLVILDEEHNVIMTICRGNIAYKRE
jgi:N-acetylglucosamine-6-phosphate deacetylase